MHAGGKRAIRAARRGGKKRTGVGKIVSRVPASAFPLFTFPLFPLK
jgi:hypothetical protein